MRFYDFFQNYEEFYDYKNVKIKEKSELLFALGYLDCIGKGVTPSANDLEDDEDSCSLRRIQVCSSQLCSSSGICSGICLEVVYTEKTLKINESRRRRWRRNFFEFVTGVQLGFVKSNFIIYGRFLNKISVFRKTRQKVVFSRFTTENWFN